MKLAIINENWNGGATRCAKDLATGLAAEYEIRHFPENSDSSAADLLPWLTAVQPDLVHLHSFYGWLPYDTLRLVARGYPTVFTPHDPRPIGQIDPVCYECTMNDWCIQCPLVQPRRRYSIFGNRYFLNRVKKKWVHSRTSTNLQIVGVSQWLLRRMREQELKRFTMWHIPNGVDTRVFCRQEDARARLGIAPDAELILFLSSRGPRWELNPNKGLVNLAEVFIEQIAPGRPNAVLAVGGEWLVPNHPQVRGLGYIAREQLPLWYSAASVYVLPTLGDNFPYTVLEAMACGCPVVANNIGGLPEQVEEGVTGHLVAKDSPQALGLALQSVLSDATQARKMGVAASNRVLERFNLGLFVQRHRELYKMLVQPVASLRNPEPTFM